MMAGLDSLEALRDAVRIFAGRRDWDQFHTPKNLAMALAVEAAEVMEHFQWLTPERSSALGREARAAVAHEIADVLIYLVRLADVLGLDPIRAARAKMALNARRYPVARARGNAIKHDQLPPAAPRKRRAHRSDGQDSPRQRARVRRS